MPIGADQPDYPPMPAAELAKVVRRARNAIADGVEPEFLRERFSDEVLDLAHAELDQNTGLTKAGT